MLIAQKKKSVCQTIREIFWNRYNSRLGWLFVPKITKLNEEQGILVGTFYQKITQLCFGATNR
jgi:hypothetical protein